MGLWQRAKQKIKEWLGEDLEAKSQQYSEQYTPEQKASEQVKEQAIEQVMMQHLSAAEAAYPPKRGVGARYWDIRTNLMRIQAAAVVKQHTIDPHQKQWKNIYGLISATCSGIEKYESGPKTLPEEGRLRTTLKITFAGLKEEISKLK